MGNHVKENLVSYIAIAIAALTAFYTYGQVSIAEKSMKISNRPYVIATKPKINQLYFSDDNTDLAFTQSFSNLGQTPAYETVIYSKVVLADKNFNPGDHSLQNVVRVIDHDSTQIVLGNNQNTSILHEYEGEIFTFEEMKKTEERAELFIYIYGTITYTDIFEDSHKTEFCYKLNFKKRTFETHNNFNKAI